MHIYIYIYNRTYLIMFENIRNVLFLKSVQFKSGLHSESMEQIGEGKKS